MKQDHECARMLYDAAERLGEPSKDARDYSRIASICRDAKEYAETCMRLRLNPKSTVRTNDPWATTIAQAFEPKPKVVTTPKRLRATGATITPLIKGGEPRRLTAALVNGEHRTFPFTFTVEDTVQIVDEGAGVVVSPTLEFEEM